MKYAAAFESKSTMQNYSPLRDGPLRADVGPRDSKDSILRLATDAVETCYRAGVWQADDDIVLIGKVYPENSGVFPQADEVLETINERINYDYGPENYFQPTESQKAQLDMLLAGAFRQWMHDCDLSFSFGELSSVEAYAFDGQQLSKIDLAPAQDFVKKAAQEASAAYRSAGVES